MLNLHEINSLRRKYLINVPRLTSTFLDNLLVSKFKKTPKTGPLLISWDLSEKCNAHCRYCDYWKKEKIGLKFEEKTRIINEIVKANVWYLSFGGGEPLLEAQLDLLIREAKKGSTVVNISTNGFLLEDYAKMLVNSGVDHITVSVESYIPEVHDAIRGWPGLFKKIEKGIEAIKKNRKGTRPFISVRTVLNRLTYKDLPNHVAYWLNIVDGIMLKPITINHIYYKVPKEMKFQPQDEQGFCATLTNLFNKFPFLDNSYYREMNHWFFNRELLKHYRCFAGIFMADIDSAGNLYCCGEERSVAGNLKQENFMDIWKSDKLTKWRYSISQNKGCSRCWSDCFLLNNFLADILGAKKSKVQV